MREIVLVIAAHPDDELLGCGGAICRHIKNDDQVHILIASQGATSRNKEYSSKLISHNINELEFAAKSVSQILKTTSLELLNLPDNRLDSIDRLDLIQVLESKIKSLKPTIIYTHHHGDVNIDHKRLNEAVVTACRPMIGNQFKRILAFETPSSTEWQINNPSLIFAPNYFVDISDFLEQKIEALKKYDIEMREYPHPRSYEGVRTYSKFRGMQSGYLAAEAFSLIRELVN